jgi:hypothetical protein
MHGVSTVLIAVDQGVVEIDLTSPGMDIVGFEYAAQSETDRAAVAAALEVLSVPENVVTLPEAAGCRLTDSEAHLDGGAHDDHEDGHGDHGHAHDENDHEDHAGHKDHEDHGDHAHDEGTQHTEFHARYAFACDDETALTPIAFPFFDHFEQAQEIEAQFVTGTGAGQAEVRRGAAVLALN